MTHRISLFLKVISFCAVLTQTSDALSRVAETPEVLSLQAASLDFENSSENTEASTADNPANEFLSMPLPGEDVDFKLKLKLMTSTYHLVHGRAKSDIGQIRFKSRLMPSNEVKITLRLKQREADDVELIAYLDLANFTMELDGGNSVLNKEHKHLMEYLAQHLKREFLEQYEGYDIPEHAFMLVQMLSYWSVSPEGFIHEKRSVASHY